LFALLNIVLFSLVHKQSGRMLDIYTDMPCININTAQDFPNYGKSLFKEKVMKVTDIEVPLAKFDKYENEQESYISEEYKFASDVELTEEERNLDYMVKTSSTQINNVHDIKPIKGKSNTIYNKHSGICIRPQLFPDAVTHVILLIIVNLHVNKTNFNIWKFSRKTSTVLFLNHQKCIVSESFINLVLLLQYKHYKLIKIFVKK